MENELSRGIVFQPWRRELTVLGLTKTGLIHFFVTLAACLLLFFLTGNIQHDVEVSISALERTTYLSELSQQLNLVTQYKGIEKTYAEIDDQNARESNTKAAQEQFLKGLSELDKEALKEAQRNGITATTTQSDLEKLVPKTKTVTEPVIGDIPRLFIFVLLPAIFTFAWNLDLKGWTLSGEFQRLFAFRKRQYFYNSKPNQFLGVEE